MKLGIISDCVHYYGSNGKVATENHIFLRQMEVLSAKFSQTVICCPFDKADQRKVLSAYTNPTLKFIPLPNVGGNTLKDKLRLLSTLGSWFKAFRQVDKQSDIVYQRFPNNLNIPGFFYFFLKRKKVFATYTGTWSRYTNEPATYRLQRWLLATWFRGPVWVYVDQARINNRLSGGFSPSYSLAEWHEETMQVQQRIDRIKSQGLSLLRMITVGTLIDYKNQLGILKACVELQQANIPFTLTIVGDGPMHQTLADFIRQNSLQQQVTLAGKMNHVELRELYRLHDFVVQAPLSEGFGKVPVEGFFHGVVPVINNIAMAAYMTSNGERGFLFNTAEPHELAFVLKNIFLQVPSLPSMIEKGRMFARTQTLDAWADQYFTTINQYFAKD